MKTIINKSLNPYFNLALEEYLLKEKDITEDLFFVWRNDPCLVIGRNQNPFNEIYTKQAQERQIPILRRISGGGTVFHDHGNINFTYITTKISKRLNNYKHFVHPIIGILERTGLAVRFVESSHIYLGDTKISGNAQTFYKDKMLHHGTLLFESDLDTIKSLLKPVGYMKTSAVESTRANTTNIKEALGVEASIEAFMDFILEEMLQDGIKQNIIELTDEDTKKIEKLAQSKYKTWNWNIGETPEFWIDKKFNGEIIQLHVKKGIVVESSIFPDQLEGLQLKDDVLKQTLSKEDYNLLQNILNS